MVSSDRAKRPADFGKPRGRSETAVAKLNSEASCHFDVAIGSIADHVIVGKAAGYVHRNAAEFQRGHMTAKPPLIKSRIAKSDHFRSDEEALAENIIAILGGRPVSLKGGRILGFAGKTDCGVGLT